MPNKSTKEPPLNPNDNRLDKKTEQFATQLLRCGDLTRLKKLKEPTLRLSFNKICVYQYLCVGLPL